MTDRKLMQQALEALDDTRQGGIGKGLVRDAITALRRALEQPAQQRLHVGDSRFESWLSEYDATDRGTKQQMRDAYAAGMSDPLVMPRPAQQEPDKYLLEVECTKCGATEQGVLTFTRPQAREPLTDEQIEQCMKQAYATVQGRNLEHAFARAIEAAHGIGEKK